MCLCACSKFKIYKCFFIFVFFEIVFFGTWLLFFLFFSSSSSTLFFLFSLFFFRRKIQIKWKSETIESIWQNICLYICVRVHYIALFVSCIYLYLYYFISYVLCLVVVVSGYIRLVGWVHFIHLSLSLSFHVLVNSIL